ncbi:hypothetical protein GCM10020000_53430 [Streptomyces olivoverticillatus]
MWVGVRVNTQLARGCIARSLRQPTAFNTWAMTASASIAESKHEAHSTHSRSKTAHSSGCVPLAPADGQEEEECPCATKRRRREWEAVVADMEQVPASDRMKARVAEANVASRRRGGVILFRRSGLRPGEGRGAEPGQCQLRSRTAMGCSDTWPNTPAI